MECRAGASSAVSDGVNGLLADAGCRIGLTVGRAGVASGHGWHVRRIGRLDCSYNGRLAGRCPSRCMQASASVSRLDPMQNKTQCAIRAPAAKATSWERAFSSLFHSVVVHDCARCLMRLRGIGHSRACQWGSMAFRMVPKRPTAQPKRCCFWLSAMSAPLSCTHLRLGLFCMRSIGSYSATLRAGF